MALLGRCRGCRPHWVTRMQQGDTTSGQKVVIPILPKILIIFGLMNSTFMSYIIWCAVSCRMQCNELYLNIYQKLCQKKSGGGQWCISTHWHTHYMGVTWWSPVPGDVNQWCNCIAQMGVGCSWAISIVVCSFYKSWSHSVLDNLIYEWALYLLSWLQETIWNFDPILTWE